jgi:hypothetical protein
MDRDGVGIPCLWRKWNPDWDLVWVATQVHKLLTAARTTSSTSGDCMNSEAAGYWESQKTHALPLEPSIEDRKNPDEAPDRVHASSAFVAVVKDR